MAVVTSGGYLRYITDETTGERYHHILDPATGYPADSGLKSVTVVCPRGIIADALSTAVFVMGGERGAQLWREYGSQLEFDLILEREDGVILVTAPIADSFETDRETEIIR